MTNFDKSVKQSNRPIINIDLVSFIVFYFIVDAYASEILIVIIWKK